MIDLNTSFDIRNNMLLMKFDSPNFVGKIKIPTNKHTVEVTFDRLSNGNAVAMRTSYEGSYVGMSAHTPNRISFNQNYFRYSDLLIYQEKNPHLQFISESGINEILIAAKDNIPALNILTEGFVVKTNTSNKLGTVNSDGNLFLSEIFPNTLLPLLLLEVPDKYQKECQEKM